MRDRAPILCHETEADFGWPGVQASRAVRGATPARGRQAGLVRPTGRRFVFAQSPIRAVAVLTSLFRFTLGQISRADPRGAQSRIESSYLCVGTEARATVRFAQGRD